MSVYWQALSNGRIDEVEEIRIFVDREPEANVILTLESGFQERTHKFAAFAVSMTLPPPTLKQGR